MPSLNFVMPHSLYWAGLLVFPMIAIALVRREKRRGPGPAVNLFTAYMFWLLAGFVGMHRFYLKSIWALVFIPIFAFILWGNDTARDMREDVSRTKQQYEITNRAHARAEN